MFIKTKSRVDYLANELTIGIVLPHGSFERLTHIIYLLIHFLLNDTACFSINLNMITDDVGCPSTLKLANVCRGFFVDASQLHFGYRFEAT